MKKEDNNKTPRLIRHGYLSNTVYFVPDDLSKRILFDPFSRIKAIWIASQAGMI